jgi:hypothetical protein
MNKTALAQLDNFTGTENYFSHPLIPGFLITDGVNFLRQNADCFWLIDEIGFAQSLPEIKHDRMLQDHQFWTLRKYDKPEPPAPFTVGAVLAAKNPQPRGPDAVLICERDTGDVAFEKNIQYTDFPFECFPNGEVKIWVAPTYCDQRNCMVAYLPSEH